MCKYSLYLAGILLMTAPIINASGNESEDRLITDFSAGDEVSRWRTVNDNVMGGKSKGGYAITSPALVFSGSTNTDGGGFSSLRRQLEPGSLAGAQTMTLRVRGDGRTYKLGFHTGERRGRIPVAYRADFTTVKDTWQTVYLPLDTFKATAYGEPVSGFSLDPARAITLGLMIYDKKDGPFRLEVAWIKFN